MGRRAESAAQKDGEGGLPEAETDHRDGEDADVDRGELEVGREPRPEEIDRFAVPLLERYVLDATRLDGGDPLPIVALPDRYVLLYVLGSLHRRFPSLTAPAQN